ncbi:MAG: flagellin [Candidatus Kapabacteria bacterium]|nr:flagellin [Candidatus Kapabacteria bacterium]
MPVINGNSARIRTNIPAENAYNALGVSERDISLRQLRLSTGKRINNASDDVAGYITSRSLQARNGALRSAQLAIGDAQNVTNILQDALSNINDLSNMIKDSAASASSGSQGTDEKVALAKAAFRMAQQIQTVIDSTVFGGMQLLDGTYSADYIIATNAVHNMITLNINMTTNNPDFNISSGIFDVNTKNNTNFSGVLGLNLMSLNDISINDLGIFSKDRIGTTLTSLANAIDNVNKVASMIGGVANRLTSQDELVKSQITNYDSAISRLEDTDVAKEQLSLIKSQFLLQASLTSLAQANQNSNAYLQLIKG